MVHNIPRDESRPNYGKEHFLKPVRVNSILGDIGYSVLADLTPYVHRLKLPGTSIYPVVYTVGLAAWIDSYPDEDEPTMPGHARAFARTPEAQAQILAEEDELVEAINSLSALTNADRRILTAGAIADLVDVSPVTVRDWAERPDIALRAITPSSRVRDLHFTPEAVRSFLVWGRPEGLENLS